MNRIPLDAFAYSRSAAGTLTARANRRLYVFEAQNLDREMDADNLSAEDEVAAYTSDDLSDLTTLAYPLVSDSNGGWPEVYVDPGIYDIYCPDDPIRPLTRWYAGVGGIRIPNVASEAALLPPEDADVIRVTGTTNITSIEAGRPRRLTIIFSASLTFTDGSNLKLAGNFSATADDTITLVHDGTNWYEISRSTN